MKNILIAIILIFGLPLVAQNHENFSSIKITQSKCIKKKGYTLILKEVISDSRCPEGVSCIWAGEVNVVVSVHQDKKFVKDETMTITGNSIQENLDWFKQYLPLDKKNLKSISVVPYPKEGSKINPKDYFIKITYIK